MKQIIWKISLSFIITFSLYYVDFGAIQSILKNQNISYFLITLIAGLFGFIIAIIPFTIQMLSMETQSLFVKELKKSNLIKGLFKRLIALLKSMFLLFVYLLGIETFIGDFEISNEYAYVFIFFIHVYLTYDFLYTLKNIIFNDIESLVNIYFKTIRESKQ
jgi:hypothetical protein